MAHFSRITKKTENSNRVNAVIMGRKTWDSIPEKFRPLPGRYNVVLTRNSDLGSQLTGPNVTTTSSLDQAIDLLRHKKSKGEIENVWVIGGSSIYKESLNSPYCDKVYVTQIHHHFDCDTFFPSLSDKFQLIKDPNIPDDVQKENDLNFQFKVFQKVK
ncbi:dihydrofolate reductase [Diaphorina citri]|uniref:dihydrofolate reductase n=1 Tax=Diaphorina citri TaxID=121845 RepID=A0A1S3CV49_DIACI|nr:dihydrofolate reductase [Diaphorina citri]XP_008467652.1 dihydrofolate reductase [Diaphorina citri]